MSIPKQSKEERIFRIYQELESDPRRLAYIECPVCNARHCILLELMPSSLEINCNGCEHLFTVYKNELSPHQWMKEELEKILLPEKEKKKAICNLLLALVIAGLCFYGGFYMFYYHWAGL